MSVECRPILSPHEVEQTVDLHGLIWDTDDRDAIPSHIIVALLHAGGILLGAFDEEQIVGFALAFPALRNGQVILWSHVTGVLPAYQGRGIGKQLKLKQRELALEKGYSCIAWTFDPLQVGNANFNFHHLGCISYAYHVDFYGTVNDGLNKGLPTDRFEVDWVITSQEVNDRLRGKVRDYPLEQMPFVLSIDGDELPVVEALDEMPPYLLAVIPRNINRLRKEKLPVALQWRQSTRHVFTTLFRQGYRVIDFVQYLRPEVASFPLNCYVLHRSR